MPCTASLIEEAPGVISGIALLLAEAPLYKRARKRRNVFKHFEHDLAKRTLLCVGNHYGVANLKTAAIAGRITLAWPQPTIPVPTQDSLELLNLEVSSGYKSHLMALQQWYGLASRDEAVELLRQIKEDTEELATLYPTIGRPARRRRWWTTRATTVNRGTARAAAPAPATTPGPEPTAMSTRIDP